MPVPHGGLTDSRDFVRSSQVGVLGMVHQHPPRQAMLRQGPVRTTPCAVPSGARLRPMQKQARQVLCNDNAIKAVPPPQSGTRGGGEASSSTRVRSPRNEAWIQIRRIFSDPLQPQCCIAKPTWATLNSWLGRLLADNGPPPDRGPGATVATPSTSNTRAEDPSDVTGRPLRSGMRGPALSAKGARDPPPPKPSEATRHGNGCCSPSSDQSGGLAAPRGAAVPRPQQNFV